MYRALLLVPVFALVAGAAQAQPANTLKSAFDALANAADVAEWGKLATDDAVVIHHDGVVHTKRQEMDELKKANGGPIPKLKNEETHLYGTTAIRRFELPSGNLVSQVWLQQDGKWRMAMMQETPGRK